MSRNLLHVISFKRGYRVSSHCKAYVSRKELGAMGKEIIITCEHAGNHVPKLYQSLFENDPQILETHRGYDIGALDLTRTCAEKLQVQPFVHSVTRLLVDLNRSLHSPELFSEFMASLDEEKRQAIIEQYYKPHREAVENRIKKIVRYDSRVLHLSVHTFTPKLNGSLRDADIGLLFDPGRKSEKAFCEIWKSILEKECDLNIKYNTPYPGVMDGFSTYLRTQFSPVQYAGLEVEVNQKFPVSDNSDRWRQIQDLVGSTLKDAYREWA